jgi:hypothetical protein
MLKYMKLKLSPRQPTDSDNTQLGKALKIVFEAHQERGNRITCYNNPGADGACIVILSEAKDANRILELIGQMAEEEKAAAATLKM